MVIFLNIFCTKASLNSQCKSYVLLLQQTETETEEDRQGKKRFVYSFQRLFSTQAPSINPGLELQ